MLSENGGGSGKEEVLWPNWIRHRSTDPEIAGSSPARIGDARALCHFS